MKILEGSPNMLKTLWEKVKLLIMSNFSFSLGVFKRLVQQTRKNQGLFGKGLNKMKISKYRNAVTKLGISVHQLSIETVSHRNIPRNERIVELCDKNELEDEFHVLLVCPAYKA